MDNNSITYFIIIIPIGMFFGGFLVARQIRVFENVPMFSKLFVQRRLLVSVVMGLLSSLMFMMILGYVEGFTTQLILSFMGIFLLASLSYYIGANIGWGKSKATTENISPTLHQVPLDVSFPDYITVEDSLSSVKVTINTKKRWGFFVMEAFQWVMMASCILPIASLLAITYLQEFLPEGFRILVWILVAGLVLYLLYTKFLEALEYIFDKEIIEINNLAVRIEKYGSKFSSKKEYPAENIKMITAMFSFGGINSVIKRSPFVNSNMPAFMMWHQRGLKRYRPFGRGVDLADAHRILEMVYAKFPQYKG